MSPTSLANRTPTKHSHRKPFDTHQRQPFHRRLRAAYSRLSPRVRVYLVLAFLAFLWFSFQSAGHSSNTKNAALGKPSGNRAAAQPTPTIVPFAPTQIRRTSAKLHFKKGLTQEVFVPQTSRGVSGKVIRYDHVWEEGAIEKVVIPLGGTLIVVDAAGEERRMTRGEDEGCLDGSCVGWSKLRLEQDVLVGLKEMRESSASTAPTFPCFAQLIPLILLESDERMLLRIPSPLQYPPDAVTLVTQFSLSRLSRFERTLREWDGPLSATIYLTDSTDIALLETYFLSNPTILASYRRMALTILKPDYSIDEESLIARLRYPINSLRNLALALAPTLYVLVTDADFVPSPNMHSILRNRGVPLLRHSASASSSATLQRTAIVVSAFALSPSYTDPYPFTTAELSSLFASSQATLTDPNAGHGPSLPSLLFRSTSPSSPDTWSYQVCFEPQWEPYYLLHRPSHPLYDERFTDQGGDKQSHSILLNAMGYRFQVLRDVWFMHPPKSTSGGVMDKADEPWPGSRLVDPTLVETEDSDPAHFSKAQKDEKRFRYFESFLPEMERNWGGALGLRWPKGCSAELVGERSFGRARIEGGGVLGL